MIIISKHSKNHVSISTLMTRGQIVFARILRNRINGICLQLCIQVIICKSVNVYLMNKSDVISFCLRKYWFPQREMWIRAFKQLLRHMKYDLIE